MLRLVADILLIDTLGFLAIALVISRILKKGDQTLHRFMRKKTFPGPCPIPLVAASRLARKTWKTITPECIVL